MSYSNPEYECIDKKIKTDKDGYSYVYLLGKKYEVKKTYTGMFIEDNDDMDEKRFIPKMLKTDDEKQIIIDAKKDKKAVMDKRYREKNKDIVIKCDCGKSIKKLGYSEHLKTKYHNNNVKLVV